MRLTRFLGGCLLALLPTVLHAQTVPVPALSTWQAKITCYGANTCSQLQDSSHRCDKPAVTYYDAARVFRRIQRY